MFTFLLIIQSLVAASMIGMILIQKSEGGGLGVGGSPAGLMSARGAADFLTRATAILATLFVVLSIVLAGLATIERAPTKIDPSIGRAAPARNPLAPRTAPAADPLAVPPPAAQAPAANGSAGNGSIPLAQ